MEELYLTLGRFTLQLGPPHGTRADVAPAGETKQARALAQALRDASVDPRPSTRRVAATVAGAVEEAEEITSSIERANEIVTAVAQGLTLDPKHLETQLNALLTVLERADREGRWEDEIRLARALVALLALIPRWLALAETLRRALAAARAIGDQSAVAWAHHEVGTFALAADDGAAATFHLNEAVRLRDRLGERAAAELTRHNLSLLPLVGAAPRRGEGGWLGRRAAIVGAAVLVALLGAGGLALAVRNGGDGSGERLVVDTDPATATDTAAATTDESVPNEPPDANDDSVEVAEDDVFSLEPSDLVANDGDPDEGDTLTVVAVETTDDTHGELTAEPAAITYRPDANYNGPANFRYTVSDGNGGSADALVVVTVLPVNDEPVAADDVVTWKLVEDRRERRVFSIALDDLLGNDADADGDELTVIDVSAESGEVELLGDEGRIEYTEDPSAGELRFTYTVADGDGATDTAEVTPEAVD